MNLSKFIPFPYSQTELDGILATVSQRIQSEVSPLKIIVFGSAATGTLDASSDLDIAVIVENESEIKPGLSKMCHIPSEVGLDIDFLVYTPEQFQRKVEAGGICESIAKEGKILFERAI